LSTAVSATMVNVQRPTHLKLEKKGQQMVKAIFTIYRLEGTKRIIKYIPKEKIKELQKNKFDIEILKEIYPPEVKTYFKNEFNNDYKKLADMTLDEINKKYPYLRAICRKSDLPKTTALKEIIKMHSKRSNSPSDILCIVSAGGWGAVFPPYLPITPILAAYGYLVVTTTGLSGSLTTLASTLICVPFIGISLLIPPFVVIVTGLAGVAITEPIM